MVSNQTTSMLTSKSNFLNGILKNQLATKWEEKLRFVTTMMITKDSSQQLMVMHD
jgi:hypothetical protein